MLQNNNTGGRKGMMKYEWPWADQCESWVMGIQRFIMLICLLLYSCELFHDEKLRWKWLNPRTLLIASEWTVRLFINEEDSGNKDKFGWGNLGVLFRTYNIWDASEIFTLDLWIWSMKSPACSFFLKAGHWPTGRECGERGKPSWAASFNALIGVNLALKGCCCC